MNTIVVVRGPAMVVIVVSQNDNALGKKQHRGELRFVRNLKTLDARFLQAGSRRHAFQKKMQERQVSSHLRSQSQCVEHIAPEQKRSVQHMGIKWSSSSYLKRGFHQQKATRETSNDKCFLTCICSCCVLSPQRQNEDDRCST